MFNIKRMKIKENYIPFTEYQLAVLDMQLFNGNKNQKIQSVLRYVMQYSKNNKLVYSIHRLYKMYTSKNKRMSQRYFYNLISELKDLNLLEEKENELFLVLEKSAKKVQEKVQIENDAVYVENTDFEAYDFPTLKTEEYNYNYNIYNTTRNEFCPSKNDTFASIEELKTIANDLYKNLKIRSNHVKTEVLNVIYAYEGRIYLKAARSYLKTVILDKKLKRDKEREEFKKNYVYNKNLSRTLNNTGANYTSNNSKRLRQIAGLNNEWGNYISNNSKRINKQFTDEKTKKIEAIENDLLGWYKEPIETKLKEYEPFGSDLLGWYDGYTNKKTFEDFLKEYE